MRSVAFICLALTALAVSPALAIEEKDDICAALDNAPEEIKKLYKNWPRENACKAVYWHEFQAKAAVELFEPLKHQSYQQALNRHECSAALDLLVPAFVNAYPRAPNIAEGRRYPSLVKAHIEKGERFDFEKYLKLNSHYTAWQTSVLPESYPEMAFCLAMETLRAAQSDIAQLRLDPPRYQDRYDALHHPSRQYPEPVQRRNNVIGQLFDLSYRRRYVPAMLALLELSQEGKAVRFVPEYQYYFLNYVVQHEGVPAARVADMLAAAAAKLPEAKRRELDRQAMLGEYKEPLPIND